MAADQKDQMGLLWDNLVPRASECRSAVIQRATPALDEIKRKLEPENSGFNLIVRMRSKSLQFRSRSDISESLIDHFSNPKVHGWPLGTGYLQQPVRGIYKKKKNS